MVKGLIIRVEGQRYAIALSDVHRVIRAVEITRVATAPEVFAGVIDVAGDIVPVVDLRRRLNLKTRPLGVDDCMVFVRTRSGRIALPVDGVLGISDELVAQIPTDDGIVHADCVTRVLADAEGLVLELGLDSLVTPPQLAAFGGPYSIGEAS